VTFFTFVYKTIQEAAEVVSSYQAETKMKLKSIVASSFLITSLTLAAAPVRPTTAYDALKDLQVVANDAADQAAVLQSSMFSSNLGWEVHASKLQALKDDVNEISRMLSQLEGRRDSLTEADRVVLDRSMVLLKEMVSNTQSAVEYLNNDRQNFWTPTYRRSINNLVNETDQLAHSLGQVLSLDKTRDREKGLEKSLELK
jgi:hypothetical protein